MSVYLSLFSQDFQWRPSWTVKHLVPWNSPLAPECELTTVHRFTFQFQQNSIHLELTLTNASLCKSNLTSAQNSIDILQSRYDLLTQNIKKSLHQALHLLTWQWHWSFKDDDFSHQRLSPYLQDVKPHVHGPHYCMCDINLPLLMSSCFYLAKTRSLKVSAGPVLRLFWLAIISFTHSTQV